MVNGRVYKSRIDKSVIILFVVAIAVFLGAMLVSYDIVWSLVINSLLIVAITWLLVDMLIHTDYTISNRRLIIRCGVLYRMTLPIDNITSISLKSSLVSSPALSLTRIELRYGKHNRVYISPQNQDSFISDLMTVNPQIILKQQSH